MRRQDLVESNFLAGTDGHACRRARKRVVDHQDFLVAPRSTAQLEREIIEFASTETDAPPIDRNTLVHMLLSITSEQNMRPEFAGDVPTKAEIAVWERKVPTFGLKETHAIAKTIIPHEIASSLFNDPLKLEVVLSNTHDIWFTPWPSRSKTIGLGATPAESFKIATGVDLLDVMRLGARIVKRSTEAHQIRFSRDELIADGAPASAVDYLFDQMALQLSDFREALKADREAGVIGHQRYTLTRYPFLAANDDTFVMLRHQWAMDRLCGGQLYFEAWSNLGAQSKALANRFKTAMNDAFEDFVGEILRRLVAKSPHLRAIVGESEMQSAWQEVRGKLPSVCDWMLLGEGHCIVIDATNHAVKSDAAQGLPTFDEYSADIHTIFTEGKFEQLLSTIALARKHGGWGGEKVDGDTDLIPLVVVPDAGVPNNAQLPQFDLVERSRPLFAHLQPHVYAPGVMQVSDVQLLEGIADLAQNAPKLPGQERDMLKLIAGWRWAATKSGEYSLQLFLTRRGFPLALSSHVLTKQQQGNSATQRQLKPSQHVVGA